MMAGAAVELLASGVEASLTPLLRKFDTQLGLVGNSQDALMERLESITKGNVPARE